MQIKNLRDEIIWHNFYDDIINTLNNNSNSNMTNQIIYGSYWASLKSILQNIDISNSKYYEQTCCCENDCSSDGWYCPAYCTTCQAYGPGPCGQGDYWSIYNEKN